MSEKKSLLEVVLMPLVIAVIAIMGKGVYEEYRAESRQARVDTLVAAFASENRIQASNELALIYASGDDSLRMKVVQALMGTIKADGYPMGSQVNIYATYTLSQVSPKWRCSPQHRRTLEALRQHQDKGADVTTFEVRIDEAIGNCQTNDAG